MTATAANNFCPDRNRTPVDFLVTMTTQVPEGTPQAAVDDVKKREAAHSLELAEEGRLLRLWRPPLAPGEWRTLGLFDAQDGGVLETVLGSMPLRIWRTDEVIPLSAHPNDPGPRRNRRGAPEPRSDGSEYFTTFTITIPPGTPRDLVETADAREADRARVLAGEGRLLRLWALRGEGRALGLWRADDAATMEAIVQSLPLRPWAVVATVQLSPHPSDPGPTHS
jgi:muconolactone delta-isomerase